MTEAMIACKDDFDKFGGHSAAGGFSFDKEKTDLIRENLCTYGAALKEAQPEVWQSSADYDCELPESLISLNLVDLLGDLKPFGHGFEEPTFLIRSDVKDVAFYNSKKTGMPGHTAVTVKGGQGLQKIMFFNEVFSQLKDEKRCEFLVSVSKNSFQGRTSVSLIGKDWKAVQ